jgi:hypothetical protein
VALNERGDNLPLVVDRDESIHLRPEGLVDGRDVCDLIGGFSYGEWAYTDD